MCHLRSKFALACGIIFIFASCGFVDFRPIEFSVEPDVSEALLSDAYSPVSIKFDTAMDKIATEGIVKISSDSGAVEGDISWDKNKMFFVPVSGWTAGVRYALTLTGVARAIDGRELRVNKYVFFYAINKAPHPLVERFDPADGESVLDPALTIYFSMPMDRLSTETALSIEGVGEKIFSWSDDDTILKVDPEKSLSPWQCYRWSLKNSAKSRSGVPLAKTVSAQFITDLDKLLPRVEKIYPVLNSNGQWIPTGGSIENDLGTGQGIAVEFNKPMGDSMLNALRFEPALAGRSEKLSEASIVFIPTRDPEPEITYTLIVSSDTRDAQGLKMGLEHQICFVADIPYLQILSFSVDGVAATASVNTEPLTVPIDIPGGGVLRFAIRFSLPFTVEEKQNAVQKITLAPFFPKTLSPVALRFVTWLSDDLVRMEWEGLKPSGLTEPHFYKLVISGGRGGITSGATTGGGMYFKEDKSFLLEAQQ